jgi:hypothetical protein
MNHASDRTKAADPGAQRSTEETRATGWVTPEVTKMDLESAQVTGP